MEQGIDKTSRLLAMEQSGEKTSPLMAKDERVVVLPGNGKILIREDTILTNLHGCAGCGRAQFTCSGIKNQWSVLCWGQQTDRRYYCLITVLSATFVLSLLGTIFFCFTDTINDAIISNMAIRNNSIAYSMWRRPTVKPLMKVHLFNYSNWQRVRDGLDKKLHLDDVGPYVYSQQLERVNIKFEGDLLTYQERNNFQFLPEKSTGAHFDQVFVPNLPLLGVVAKSVSLQYFGQIALKTTLSTFANHKDAFLKLPVQRFLWGYDDSIIDLAKPVLSLQGQLNFDKFGLLVTKNGTVSDRLTINTGENDKDKMNILEKLNGDRQLKHWGSTECNRIDASDGTIFPPSMLDKKDTLHVFYANLCRRLPFNYVKDVEIADGIQLLRYRMPDTVFDDPAHFPPNQCYCEIDTGECPPRGVINVTACAMGAPALASFPHFHLGDPSLRKPFTGLNPNPELHESYLDVHPTLGISLSGKSSLQINIQVRKTNLYPALSFLEDGLILPVAWIEMTVEELPDSLRSLVYHGTYSTAAAQLGLTVFCVLTLVLSGLSLFILLATRRKKPCATLKIVPAETELFRNYTDDKINVN
ncbi:scavenger receptor class B member 1-like [Colias croceus]|uniref:scavenger receptor class B member 1-like n=1 Tax=Colias crocea TaxID=72248 RepID=UPI001E27E9F8|nr:scavenger receptor class B member 1-like [Colias croceus]